MAAYLQRARFIAIAEFGPRSLIYHEGRAYRVYRAKLPPGVRTQDGGKLATASLFICDVCGGVHQPDEPERCHTCGAAMAGTHPIRNVLRIDNVETVPPGLGTESSYDSLLEGGVTSELVSEIPKFPASWERTGNFDRFGLASRKGMPNTRVDPMSYAEITHASEQGIFATEQGIESGDQGIFPLISES